MAKTYHKRVVSYCRVSAETQIENTSIDTQNEKIRDYCKLYDYELVQAYEDKGKSGSLTETRSGYNSMLEFAVNPKNNIDAIICYKADRMHRSLKNLLIMIEDVLTPNGIGFVSITENVDTSKETGMMFLQMVGSFAEFERKTILRRCKEGRIKKAKDNKFTGGGIPYGYIVEDKDMLIVDNDRAAVVKQIFKSKADGDSLQRIADNLNNRGIKNAMGCNWSKQGISYMLKNRAYIGEYMYDGRKENNGIVYKIPKIISKQLYNRVNP